IALEDRDSINVREILPLDATFRIQRLHRIDELADEGHVFFAAHAMVPQPLIKWVLEQDLVVRADVENHRQTVLRRHTGTRGVERELADRNAHAACAEIAKTENALAVRHDDEPHFLFRPVDEELANSAAGADRQEHAARLAEN